MIGSRGGVFVPHPLLVFVVFEYVIAGEHVCKVSECES